jgi:hypothetical protein
MPKKKLIIINTLYTCILLALSYFIFRPYYFLAYAKYLGQITAVPSTIWTYDSLLSWKPKPLSSATSWRTGERIDYVIDELGMRSIDNKGSLVGCEVFALGDSNTFGHAISMENHWLTRMRESIPKVKVYNLGVEGYGVDQALLRLKQEISIYKPKLVLAFVKHFDGSRHLHALTFGNNKPYFSIDSKGALKLHSEHMQLDPIPEGEIEMPYEDTEENSIRLGVRIIQEMYSVTKSSGAKFLLLAGWRSLCEGVPNIPCVNVKSLIADSRIIAADGTDFSHINAEGSKKLGRFIAHQIKSRKLMPSKCSN